MENQEKLKENLGYLENGSKSLINKLENIIIKNGGVINLSNSIEYIEPIRKGGALIKSKNIEKN